MNLIKLNTNQTEKNKTFCLILFLFIFFYLLSVLYVNAAEIHTEENNGEQTIPVSIMGTNIIDRRIREMNRIRMANEDAIQVIQDNTAKHSLSEKEYNILTRIVEAEAGNLDKKSKILVANVILNRIDHEQFPDTVEEVVFQNVNGAVQFSPIADGRYYTVKIAESTKESVDRALAGEDYSEGALYFMERSISARSNVDWFDNCLTKLFKYESHEFFK